MWSAARFDRSAMSGIHDSSFASPCLMADWQPRSESMRCIFKDIRTIGHGSPTGWKVRRYWSGLSVAKVLGCLVQGPYGECPPSQVHLHSANVQYVLRSTSRTLCTFPSIQLDVEAETAIRRPEEVPKVPADSKTHWLRGILSVVKRLDYDIRRSLIAKTYHGSLE